MTHIVFLNGPLGCGKDTTVKELIPYIDFHHVKFAAPLYRMTAALFDREISWVQKNKDQRFLIINNDRLRDLMIGLSEEFLKKQYGNELFGKMAILNIQESSKELIIISDSGFLSEASVIMHHIGVRRCLKINIKREGHTFDGDSRSYWDPPAQMTESTVLNSGTKHDLGMTVLHRILKKFPNTKLLKEPQWIK